MNIENELRLAGLTCEDYEAFLQECSDKINGIIDIDWQDIIDKYNIPYDRRRVSESMARNILGSNFVREYYLNKFGNFDTAKVERIKLQTEKLEYAKWQREQARDELIVEKICNAITTLPSLDMPIKISQTENIDKDYLLPLSDAHYGIEFELKDLDGQIINAYSPEIFESRMHNLLIEVINLVVDKKIQHLHIWELGDGIQGILRLNSQLMKLKYGVIDSSIRYANFLANWLNELSKYTRITFQMTIDSNHNQLRICNAPKNAFPEENMSKIMLVLIRERLKDNPNIVIKENQTEVVYHNICGYNVIGVHGEINNANLINDMSRIYNKKIDYLIGGHIHHKVSEEIHKGCELISVRSLIGTDPYAISLYKTSDSGTTLLGFTPQKGLIEEYYIKL